MNTTQSENTKNKHRGLKKLGVAILLVIVLLYIVTLVANYGFEQNVKQTFITTNEDLTKLDVTIDNVKVDAYRGITDVYRLKIFNPADYISPYAIAVGEISLNSSFGNYTNIKHIIFTSAVFKDVNINYDINSKKNINLYQVLDNITKSLAPTPNFSPLTIFQNNKSSSNQLRYNGIQFHLDKLVIEKPTINIYSNGVLVKSIDIQDIVLTFHNLKQPTNYGYILLASSLQVIDKIDKTIRK